MFLVSISIPAEEIDSLEGDWESLRKSSAREWQQHGAYTDFPERGQERPFPQLKDTSQFSGSLIQPKLYVMANQQSFRSIHLPILLANTSQFNPSNKARPLATTRVSPSNKKST